MTSTSRSLGRLAVRGTAAICGVAAVSALVVTAATAASVAGPQRPTTTAETSAATPRAAASQDRRSAVAPGQPSAANAAAARGTVETAPPRSFSDGTTSTHANAAQPAATQPAATQPAAGQLAAEQAVATAWLGSPAGIPLARAALQPRARSASVVPQAVPLPRVPPRTLQPGRTPTLSGGQPGTNDSTDATAAPSSRLFAPTSFWYASVRTAPVAANSAAMVSAIASTVAATPWKTAALNSHSYTTAFYTSAANTPLTNVAWDNCQNNPWVSPGPITAQLAGVPIPADAQPAAGSDAEMTIYSPSTDTLWEFWLAQKTASGWSACWGGRIDNVSTSPGYFPGGFGATGSGLPVAGGMISLKDLASGVIDHALSLELPMIAATTVNWPAQRTDGRRTGAGAVPMGTRFRLDPSLDLSTLGLSPIGLMVAKSAQTYGFVVTDTAANVALQGEPGIPTPQSTSTDPWSAPLAASSGLLLKNFPWSSLQALPNNYGE